MISFRRLLARPTTLAASLAFATPAMAHPGHDLGTGALAGFIHPFTGLDHLTAMICVGLWSARAYPTRIWAMPAAFMSAMAAGFLLGHSGIAVPAEALVLLSMPLLALGAAWAPRVHLGLACGIAGFFALAHGYAHASEASGDHFGFAVAMLAATALLHGFGLLIGRQFDAVLRRRRA